MNGIARRFGSTLLLLAASAAAAAAQSKRAPVLHPPQPPIHTQWAGATPAPSPDHDRSRWDDQGREHRRDHDGDRYYQDGDRYYHDDGDGHARVRRVPAVVTSDGRVFADFGNGYEQVLRSCAAAYDQGAAQGAQPSAAQTYTTPTYTLPNYGAQQYATITPAPVQAQQTGQGSVAVPAACWTTDAQGAVIVVRP